MIKRRMMLCIVLFLWSISVAASERISHTDRRMSEAEETNIVSEKAKRWGLSISEYERYLELIDGPLGHWSREIDPVMALGMFAESDAQRTHFALLYAQHEHELVTRALAFEQSYREAFSQQFPNAQVINRHLMQPYHDNRPFKRKPSNFASSFSGLQAQDRLLLFVEKECTRCVNYISRLQKILHQHPDVFVDIFLVGGNDADEVRAWAKDHRVDLGLVQQRRLTLNVDQGNFETLKKQSQHSTPFFLSRQTSVFAVDPSEVMQL